jgi:hypothetical protein
LYSCSFIIKEQYQYILETEAFHTVAISLDTPGVLHYTDIPENILKKVFSEG